MTNSHCMSFKKKGIDAFSRRPYETYFTVLYPKPSTNPVNMKYDRATSVSFSHGQLQSDFQEQRWKFAIFDSEEDTRVLQKVRWKMELKTSSSDSKMKPTVFYNMHFPQVFWRALVWHMN